MSTEMPHSEEAITKSTGKSWDAWHTILNDWGAADKSHTEIARHLVEDHKVDGWWAQGITIGYERHIGRREVGQREDGLYSASVSKTMSAGAEAVYAALVDDARRAEWLPEGVVSFRTGSEPKSARFDDEEHGVIIAFFLTAKGDAKTAVQIQAEKLPSKEAGEEWKAVWKPHLADLAKVVAG